MDVCRVSGHSCAQVRNNCAVHFSFNLYIGSLVRYRFQNWIQLPRPWGNILHPPRALLQLDNWMGQGPPQGIGATSEAADMHLLHCQEEVEADEAAKVAWVLHLWPMKYGPLSTIARIFPLIWREFGNNHPPRRPQYFTIWQQTSKILPISKSFHTFSFFKKISNFFHFIQ